MQHIRLDVEFRSPLKLMGIYLNLPIIKKTCNSDTVVTFGMGFKVYKTFKCKTAGYTCVLEVNSLKFLWASDGQLF